MPSSCPAERNAETTHSTGDLDATSASVSAMPRPAAAGVAAKLSGHSYSYVAMFTICAQAAGLIAAYALGFAYHYNSLIKTHCRGVPNFWPSISKATGDHLPGRYVWRLAISLTTFPRMMEAFLYYNYFATQKPSLFQQRWWYRWLNRINLFFMVVELFLFYTVTFVSSKEHMDMHIYTWVAFLAFSMSHMITFLVLFACPSGERKKTQLEKISLMVRCLMLAVQVLATGTFFHYGQLHIWDCAPYAFSYAAISECVIAASNLGFQSMQLLDFKTSTHWGEGKQKTT